MTMFTSQAEPNPILVKLREFRSTVAYLNDRRGLYLSWLPTYTVTASFTPEQLAVVFKGETPEHIDHARRVLTRLVNL